MKNHQSSTPSTITAVYQKRGKRHFAVATDRRVKKDIELKDVAEQRLSLIEGDLIRVKLKPAHRANVNLTGYVLEIVGKQQDIDTIVLHSHEIPTEFPDAAVEQAEKAKAPKLGKRQDLRKLPLVTIDGADARDFDDAVFAEPYKTNGIAGWHLIVAIADVAHYVPVDSALDQEARLRGNSVYLPGRVVPMLPEALSNGWCSLVPDEERACLAVHMYITADGALQNFEFIRGLMRSHKRWTYEEVETTLKQGEAPEYLQDLKKAYQCLRKARDNRGALNIHSDELSIVLEEGIAKDIIPRPSLESHQLIEEFMVLANVAAAKALKEHNALYRIHPKPSFERLDKLYLSLKELGLKFTLPKDGQVTPHLFNDLLERGKKTKFKDYLNLLVLTSQNQARYLPGNIGHFGLGLESYTHFTSPIRRYSDLVVHRALIDALNLGAGGVQESQEDLEALSDSLYETERRAIKAERDAVSRHVAVYYEQFLGDIFTISVVRVFKHGLIVLFQDTRAEGYIPRESLPTGRYRYDEDRQILFNPKNGIRFCMGDMLTARITMVDTITGNVRLEPVDARTDDKSPVAETKEIPRRRRKKEGHSRKYKERAKAAKRVRKKKDA